MGWNKLTQDDVMAFMHWNRHMRYHRKMTLYYIKYDKHRRNRDLVLGNINYQQMKYHWDRFSQLQETTGKNYDFA